MKWRIAPRWDGAAELARKLRCGELIAQLLYNRGIADADAARSYLSPKLTDLHDPETLGGAVAAAEHVARAVRDGRSIAIFGDYDVDGITGSAILYRCLQLLGATVRTYIPHRIDEGYGLNNEALEALAGEGVQTVITVDCGITSHDCATRAAQIGLELIITDHHNIGDTLPQAAAVVHPTIDPTYPNRHLCGAGVALKLAWQISRAATGRQRVSEELKSFLLDATCMAALGTIADVVPLLGENRVLATFGLRGLVQTEHPGLQALIDASGLNGKRLGAYDVGFMLAPRLNAAGRMGHAREAAQLLLHPESIDCPAVARELTRLNEKRQRVEREIFEQALEMAERKGCDGDEHRAIVLAGEGWHGGVVGIVAARMVRRFGKPTVLIALDGPSGQGSARSIEGFHLAEALSACSDHLVGHGGHAMAAGLRIEADKVDAFAEALSRHAAERVTDEMLAPTLDIDAEVNLAELSLPMARQIESMAPFGAGNRAVVLAVREATLHAAPRRMGVRGNTLGLILSTGRSRLRCVGFGMGEIADRLTGVRQVRVAGEPVISTFNGPAGVELHLKDVRWD